MKPILIVNPELGWDSVVAILDAGTLTDKQCESLEKICKENEYILIDWKSVSTVKSFLDEND